LVTALIAVGCAVLCVAIGFAGGFFCAQNAVRMGLKWNMQVQRGAMPTTQKQDEASAAAEHNFAEAQEKKMREWVHGPDKPTRMVTNG
jgi:uncharacterized MAPEG superfamily protein